MDLGIFAFIHNLDLKCFNWVNHSIHNAALDGFMPLLSYSGQAGLIWLLFGLALFVFGSRESKKTAILMVVAVGASYLAGECIKHTFDRPRPFMSVPGVELLVGPPGSFSFPSEHTANAFAAWFVLARKQYSLSWVVVLLAFAMAFSRVYVGVHYPLDVLAGSLLGTFCAALVLKYEKMVFKTTGKFKTPPNWGI